MAVSTLLLVDDDDCVRFTFAALLECEGFLVEQAGSHREAEDLIRTGRSFDAVLLDRSLGDGDGASLVPIVRAHQAGARIVMLSGGPADDVTDIDATFVKGRSVDGLFASLETLLSTAR